MHDLRLELRARNNVLWHAIFDLYESIAAFCRHHDFSNHVVGEYLNLTRSPYFHPKSRMKGQSDRMITATAQRLCDVTGIGPDELWPLVLYSNLIAPVRVVEVAASSCLALTAARRVALPPVQEDHLMDAERRQAMNVVLDTLTPREARVIRLRFGITTPDDVAGADDEHTLIETGAALGCSPERIRQIEQKALKKLRHPSRLKRLRGVVSGEEGR